MSTIKDGIKNKTFTLIGNFLKNTGYSEYARSVAEIIYREYGKDNNIILIDPDTPEIYNTCGLYDFKNSFYGHLQNFIRKIPTQQIQKENISSDVNIIIAQPFFMTNENVKIGKVNFCVSAMVEMTKFHPRTLSGFVNNCDKIFVMSNFNINTIKQVLRFYNVENINLDVEKLPYFINENIEKFTPDQEMNKKIQTIPQQFLFLSVGVWYPGGMHQDRKNFGRLIKEFLQTNGNNPNVGLVLKTGVNNNFSKIEEYQITKRITTIANQLGIEYLNNIYLLFGQLTHFQLLTLYKHPKIKAIVSFTRGESLGLPLAQFSVVSGKPIIASKWSGQIDFLSQDYSVLLGGDLVQLPQSLLYSNVPTFTHTITRDSQWFEIDNTSKQVFEYVINNYEELCILAKEQQKQTKQILSYENCKLSLIKAVEGLNL